ncbi:pyridoxamine 5'-phosphate oxidase family protein [Mucilaginibacter sp. HMF5004]|uniref:pyridoxamine 5'-phosphate oxidase family protein n=1 Tax=Mucilaginibacter rivuli TaxID=2857527 RepID=UPI001C5D8B0E|nr:pyridoxamine 5'-phosphate oxidase family protein [Mucilaginibacter rivuli]MBW4889073.1 pyridoxamine 5'-phosphate oxidase family protein [Mucilaginibacter rivuli]
MDSINRNQPEDTRQPLEGNDAVKKIKEIAEKASTGFLCTSIKTGLPVSARPMAVQQIDDEGNFWFLSAKDSDMNKEIEKDPMVHLFFQASAHSGFLNIYGIAEISFDKAKIHELWKPLAKVWFTEGEDDPRISIVKVSPTQGYYWDNKHGNLVAFAKMIAGLVTGQTLDDSVEGKITV